MKYIITKTDISINGIIHSEGSVIDSSKHNQKTIDSISHLLIPLGKSSATIILDASQDNPIDTKINDEKGSKKSSRKPKTSIK